MSSIVSFKCCSTVEEALVVSALLNANDIPSWITNLHHAHAEWFLVPAFGGVIVTIPEAAAEDALAVVQSSVDEAYVEHVQGPALNLSRVRWRAWVMLFLYFFYVA